MRYIDLQKLKLIRKDILIENKEQKNYISKLDGDKQIKISGMIDLYDIRIDNKFIKQSRGVNDFKKDYSKTYKKWKKTFDELEIIDNNCRDCGGDCNDEGCDCNVGDCSCLNCKKNNCEKFNKYRCTWCKRLCNEKNNCECIFANNSSKIRMDINNEYPLDTNNFCMCEGCKKFNCPSGIL